MRHSLRLLAWSCIAAGVLVAGVIAPIFDETWTGPIAGTWMTGLGLLLLFVGGSPPAREASGRREEG